MENNSICQKCIATNGGCCVDVTFSIHISELDPFLKFETENGGLPSGHSLKTTKEEPEFYTYDSGEKKCMFLGEDLKCSIYAKRPLMCRLYPILWRKPDIVYIDMLCPLSHVIPLHEIANWVNSPQNKKQMSNMDDLDFDARNRQYLNINLLTEQNSALKILEEK